MLTRPEVMMKKTILVMGLLSSVSLLSHAHTAHQLCDVSPQQLGAVYQFTQGVKHYDMKLWRYNGKVAQVISQPAITNQWNKTVSGSQRLVQYFDHYQRGIEYQPQRANDAQWQRHTQLITEQLLTQLTADEVVGTGCQQAVKYHGKIGDNQYQVTWLPQLQLLKYYQQSNAKQTLTIELTRLIADQATISQQFNRQHDYQLIDFADIGDNESDPFWAKMINMGYVTQSAGGFYQADGREIK